MNQVAEKKTAPLPANTFEQDAGQGLGKLGQEDLALPFLKILGQLSPEVNKHEPSNREKVCTTSNKYV